MKGRIQIVTEALLYYNSEKNKFSKNSKGGITMNRPWLAEYPKEIPGQLDLTAKPLQSYLTEAASLYGNKVAIHFMGKEILYKELYESALKFSAYLRKLGIKKGDRVAIMLPNTPQSVIAYYGILYAGGVVVQTNPLYMEREIEYQMKDSGAKVILTLDILYPRVSKVMKDTDLEHIIVTAIKDYLPFPKNFIYPFIQKKQYGLVVKVEPSHQNHLFNEIIPQPTLN